MRCFSFLLALLLAGFISAAQVTIAVFPDSSLKLPVSGRLFVYTSSDTTKGISPAPDPVHPQPMYAVDVRDWQAGQPVVINDQATAFSEKLSQLKPGVYQVAAILDADPNERGAFNPGNYYSGKEARLVIDEAGKGTANLYLNKRFDRRFGETELLKEVTLKSDLLSAFHKKDVFLKAAVVLPEGYNVQTATRYPVVYVIPGWGGTHYDAQNPARRKRYGMGEGLPKIYVYLNPETQTPYGLHCFVDSRVNGPWGEALVKELQPYIRETFAADTSAVKTFVVGQSSGGYAALWLPLHYPDAFGGGWAVSPDPVDFHDFTGVNLYDPKANFYQTAAGEERPFFLVKGKPMTTLRKMLALEIFEGNGGQFQSFDAEFGMPDQQGRPKPLFDRTTGVIHQTVVKEWAPYDLGRYVTKNWGRLKPKLSGKKLHVYAGANDNFLLNRSVAQFGEKARAAGADIVVDLIPDADHFSIWSPAFTSRVQSEIDALIQSAVEKKK